MNSIVMALASNLCKLETLNLSDNHLGNEECIMLAGVLETMFELKVGPTPHLSGPELGRRARSAGTREARERAIFSRVPVVWSRPS